MLRATGNVLFFLLSSAPLVAEEIRGVVRSLSGPAVEHARVTAAAEDRHVFTDSHGGFVVECAIPCVLLVEHPRFSEKLVDITQSNQGELNIELEAKQEFYEEVMVTASRGAGDAYAPVSIASTVLHADQKVGAPSTLLEVVEGSPGVAENGQGGLFQVFSIRGVSRQRVMSLISGMQVVGERRAGVSTSFVDPLLMDGVEVLRGPASTYYGSGALGGIVQVFPREFDGWRVATGYSSFADETYQTLGWGDGEWSFGFAHRTRDDDTAADGTPVNERFTQYSATLARRWRGDGRTYEILAVPTLGRDIGKSSSDFPDSRITNYPQETHLLFKAGVTSDEGWRAYGYVHPNNLRTEVLRIGNSLNVVRNEAFDIGGNYQRELDLARNVSGRFGVDYFGRRGVRATERDESLTGGAIFDSQTLDGEQDEAAAYGALAWNWGSATFQAGSRFTYHQQDNADATRRDDTALTGFLGLVQPIGGGVELTANVGTGLRFASLSERFFSGSTGRGTVIGNPDLDPEESINADLGLRWYGNRVFLAGQVFRTEIDDYIERIDVTDDLRTFVNLTSGTLEGFEIEGFFRVDDRWRINWSGHLLDGESDDGRPLADVPSDRLQIGASYSGDRWAGRFTYQYRASKDDPGSGENAIPEAELVSVSLEYELRDGLKLSLSGRNLLDEVYFNSADDRAPVAAGRAFGVGLLWAP